MNQRELKNPETSLNWFLEKWKGSYNDGRVSRKELYERFKEECGKVKTFNSFKVWVNNHGFVRDRARFLPFIAKWRDLYIDGLVSQQQLYQVFVREHAVRMPYATFQRWLNKNGFIIRRDTRLAFIEKWREPYGQNLIDRKTLYREYVNQFGGERNFIAFVKWISLQGLKKRRARADNRRVDSCMAGKNNGPGSREKDHVMGHGASGKNNGNLVIFRQTAKGRLEGLVQHPVKFRELWLDGQRFQVQEERYSHLRNFKDVCRIFKSLKYGDEIVWKSIYGELQQRMILKVKLGVTVGTSIIYLLMRDNSLRGMMNLKSLVDREFTIIRYREKEPQAAAAGFGTH